ncbi:uncharacterized protein LOC144465062 isoform X1 [Epinephelus lanceolatus]
MGDNQIQDMSKMVGGTQRLAAARLHSSGDWWCTCECCAPVPTEEECLCCKKWDRLQPYFQGLDVTEDETPPPGVVSSWALSRARETYFGRTLESRARGINKHGSTPVSLCSSDANLLTPPLRTKHWTWGDRPFSIAAPSLWSTLSKHIRDCTNLSCFKSLIKTHNFKMSFNV